MIIASTIEGKVSEKATNLVSNKFEKLLEDRNLKEKFKTASKEYFDKKFENCNFSEDFDFEAVETYLLNNLDNKIIAIFYDIKNIGQEGRASIRENVLCEAVAYGKGNEQAIRKYCNAIIDFVGACLNDKISDSDKILASEITAVTNEHYKLLVNTINSTGHEILNKIDYFGSFAEQIDKIGLPKVINKNKFSYANPSVGFYGRTAEQKEIEKFMTDEHSLLFWTIIGRGGVGKSKFALHICKKYAKQGWKAVWLNKDNIERINKVTHDSGYNKPLLLVCDYAGEYIESIRTLLLKLSDNIQCKIRVLLLERSGYNQTSDKDYSSYLDTLYNRLLSGHNSDEIKEIEYLTDSLNLDDYILNDADMFCILDDFSNCKLSKNDKEEIVAFVKGRSIDALNRDGKSHHEERCLFLLFTADAFLNGNNYRDWDTNELMQQYVERFKRNLEAHYSENICKRAYIILSVATAIGTVNIKNSSSNDILGCYIESIKNELNYNIDTNELKMFLSMLCEKDTLDLNVYPMFPDLVGEFFFIDIFSRMSNEYQLEWYKVFCSEKCQEFFCNFLIRCLIDWHSLEKFQNIIRQLFCFSKENNYKTFIEKCIDNSFFMGLSYYYTLTENDLIWIKNIFLINKNERRYLIYACILLNATSKMSNADDRLKIANQIKNEILSKYDTAEIAKLYAKAVLNANKNTNNR